MHKTRSCAHTLHKDRVSGVREIAEKVRWKKLFKGWTALNEIWRGTGVELLAKYATFRPAELTSKELRVWQTLKGRQRDEGGEEARVMPRVSGQDPNDCGKTGGNTQSQFFACIQKMLRE